MRTATLLRRTASRRRGNLNTTIRRDVFWKLQSSLVPWCPVRGPCVSLRPGVNARNLLLFVEMLASLWIMRHIATYDLT
jgi:hypothetical protein